MNRKGREGRKGKRFFTAESAELAEEKNTLATAAAKIERATSHEPELQALNRAIQQLQQATPRLCVPTLAIK